MFLPEPKSGVIFGFKVVSVRAGFYTRSSGEFVVVGKNLLSLAKKKNRLIWLGGLKARFVCKRMKEDRL